MVGGPSGVENYVEVTPSHRPQEDGRTRTPDLPARPCDDGTFPGDVIVSWRQWSSSIPAGCVWCNSDITPVMRLSGDRREAYTAVGTRREAREFEEAILRPLWHLLGFERLIEPQLPSTGVFFNHSSMEETPKIMFHIPRNPKFGNVCKAESIYTGQRNSFPAKLVTRKFVYKGLLYT